MDGGMEWCMRYAMMIMGDGFMSIMAILETSELLYILLYSK